ncbi:MAG TPA: CopD family protein [Ktedonobacteraceae bacterium]|nr:CopD family protein [Ktedonobacteraceae bacterium]
MNIVFRAGITRLFFLLALPCALALVFLVPAVASAHTIQGVHIQSVLGGNLTGSSSGTIDGPALFNLVMITLVEITAIFWVGAQFWLMFVLQLAHENNKDVDTNVQVINQKVQRRFERVWAVPTLLVLLLANIGIIVGQILSVTGQWSSAFSPQLLWQLATGGNFGTFWSLREISIIIALLLALYVLLFKERPQAINNVLPSVNLLLGAILFIAMSISGHASVVTDNFQTYAVIVDWFHLVAAALWVGSMMYIATTYLPVLQRRSLPEQVYSLITTLPYYARLAIVGIVILAVTGIFSAQVHLTASQQLLDTAYGRTLIVKSVLVVVLLITSISHLFFLRPRLAKEYNKYLFAKERIQFHQVNQVKLREERLTQHKQRLTTILRWEPLLGVAILLCVGLMSVFGGTLSATTTGQQPQQPTTSKSSTYNATVQTTDNKFTVKLNVNPNRFGTNVFTVTVVDNSTGKATTSVSVSLFTTMLDMDMGTDSVALQANGKGEFSASGNLSMGGNWEIRIAIHTPDGTLHEARIKLFTPF